MAVYLDCAATTPVDPRVREAVLRYLDDEFGNAGSRTHAYGQRARRAVEQARQQVAAVVGASRGDVIFTSGATESNNLAILGVAGAAIARATHVEGAADDLTVRGTTPEVDTADGADVDIHAAMTTGVHTALGVDGGAPAGALRPGHVVTTAIEHHAVLEPIRELERRGFRVTIVQPEAGGCVDARAVFAAIEPDTVLVSVMHVNNETGVIQPIDEIATLMAASSCGCALHVDAAQGFGKDLAPLRHPRIDLISVSGHKLGAPKGVGALIARRQSRRAEAADGSRRLANATAPDGQVAANAAHRRTLVADPAAPDGRAEQPRASGMADADAARGTEGRGTAGRDRGRPALAPLMFGGGQERGLRPGTLPVHLIVGLGLAAELAVAECADRQARCRAFGDRLLAGLEPLAPIVNGDRARAVPHILNLTIPGVESDAAMEAWTDLVAISNGAACSSQSYTCSHVLGAMRLDADRAEGALRFSWSHDSTLPDLPRMIAAIAALRASRASRGRAGVLPVDSLPSAGDEEAGVQAAPLQMGALQVGRLQVGPVRAAPLQAGPLQEGPLQAGPIQGSKVQVG